MDSDSASRREELQPAESPVDAQIVVRDGSHNPVDGTAFTCTAHEGVLTPCDEFSYPQRGTVVSSRGAGNVQLWLSRNSDAVDGGRVAARIDLEFLLEGEILASATQVSTSFAGEVSQGAIEGWIAPYAVSRTPEGRNAGYFSLTFDWGTVSGTYDTADAQ